MAAGERPDGMPRGAAGGWQPTARWRLGDRTSISSQSWTAPWFEGEVPGSLVEAGWGATLGFPGLVLAPEGTPVPVHVFESADLPAHWARLDGFEGPGYRRVVTTVRTASGDVEASIYVLA